MAQDRFITVYSTTSPQDGGVFEHLLPIFQSATGLKVDVAAVGTGEALALGRRGYVDALFVHDVQPRTSSSLMGMALIDVT